MKSWRKNKSAQILRFVLLASLASAGSGRAADPGSDVLGQQLVKEPILSACSVAPYATEVVVLDLAGRELRTIALKPGRCRDIALDLPSDGALTYTRAIKSDALERLTKYEFFQSGWRGIPVFAQGGAGVWACVTPSSGQIEAADREGRCQPLSRSIELGFLAPNALRFSLFIEDPLLCQRIQPTCAQTDGSTLLEWASSLSRSLEISIHAWRTDRIEYGLIPTAIGLETKDWNGPFARGILVTEQQSPTTPLGSPVPADDFDILVSFNDEPIYDRDDFIMLLIEHGHKRGYDEPYRLEFERAGRLYAAEGFLAFHRGIYGDFFIRPDGSCRNPTAAMLSAALEEATFYTKPILACANFDLGSGSLRRKSDCEFAVRNLTAAYRQFCPKVTQVSAIIGAIFMPGRGQTESFVKRLAPKQLSRSGAALVVEVSEEVARSIITLPPGVSAEGNWGSIGQQTGFGVAIGTGVRQLTYR
ncbi:MAG: hypothetical protein QNJ19_09610 [Woeseiaceae bacterium]|nr:hypothetical protein [Woeseiaceae bacterium]